jgi:ABC-type spermidine/putrescine transport system permease subunit I
MPTMVTVKNAPPTIPTAAPLAKSNSSNRQTLRAYLALSPFIFLYIVLIVVPSLGLIVKSFSKDDQPELEILNPRLLMKMSFTVTNYRVLFTDSYNIRTILTTIAIAAVAVALTFVIGTPIAYQLAVDRGRFASAASWVVSLPIYLPSIVVAYALVLFFGPNGMLNAGSSGLHLPQLDIAFTTSAVVLGTLYVLLPIYVRMLAAAFIDVPNDLVQASLSLGAGELRTLIRVVLPIVRPTILAAVILNFAFGVGMVEIALIVGGGALNVPYLPVEILQRSLTFTPNAPLTAAMGAVLVVIVLISQAAASRLNRKASSSGKN